MVVFGKDRDPCLASVAHVKFYQSIVKYPVAPDLDSVQCLIMLYRQLCLSVLGDTSLGVSRTFSNIFPVAMHQCNAVGQTMDTTAFLLRTTAVCFKSMDSSFQTYRKQHKLQILIGNITDKC